MERIKVCISSIPFIPVNCKQFSHWSWIVVLLQTIKVSKEKGRNGKYKHWLDYFYCYRICNYNLFILVSFQSCTLAICIQVLANIDNHANSAQGGQTFLNFNEALLGNKYHNDITIGHFVIFVQLYLVGIWVGVFSLKEWQYLA